MSVILGFFIFFMLLLLCYTVYRSIKRKMLIMLIPVCAQLFAISIAIMCFVNNVLALELIQACFLLLGIVMPCIYLVYDFKKMIAKIKIRGVYEGLIEPLYHDIVNEINPIINELQINQFFNDMVNDQTKMLTNIKRSLIKAHVCIGRKDYKGAADIYSVLASIIDNNPGLLFNYANICFHNADFTKAGEVYKKAIDITQNSQEQINKVDVSSLYYNMGCALYKSTRYESAVKAFEKALQGNNSLTDARENIALAYAAAGDVQKALEHYREAAAEGKNSYRLHFTLGSLLAENKSYGEAEAEFRICVQIKPEAADGFLELGRVLSLQCKHKQAIEAFDDAVRHSPGNYLAYYSKGNIYYKLGMKKEAIESFKSVIRMKPDNFNAHYNMAVALDELGFQEDAIASFKKALEIKPDFIDACNNLGVVLSNTGRLEEALEILQEGIRKNPGEYSLFFNMGIALSESGRNREAVTAYRNALDIKPDEFEIYYYLGAALMETRNYNDAIEAYKSAIRIKPSDFELYYGIASVYSLLGRYDIAFDNLQMAISLNTEIKADVRVNKAFDSMRGREDFRKMLSI